MLVRVYGNLLACLMVDMDDGAVLPLGTLDADPDHRHSGELYSVMRVSHHCYVTPTMNIPECLVVGLPPLGGKAAFQALQRVFCLCDEHAVS